MPSPAAVMCLAAGLLVAVLAGCSAEQSTDAATGAALKPEAARSNSGGQASDENSEQAKASIGSEQSKQSERGGTGAAAAVPATQLTNRDRLLARTATLTLRARQVHEAAGEARRVAAAADGYVGSERSGKHTVSMRLSVPGDKLESVLDDLEELGERDRRQIDVVDVTDKVVDVKSRIESQRKSVERARVLFDKASTITEIMSIEGELAARESELESLLSRQETLSGQVAMASIDLSISKLAAAVVDESDEEADDGFLAGFSKGWHAFTTMLGSLSEGIGAATPFLLAVGVPAVALGWLLRRRRARPIPAEDAPGT